MSLTIAELQCCTLVTYHSTGNAHAQVICKLQLHYIKPCSSCNCARVGHGTGAAAALLCKYYNISREALSITYF